MAAGDERSITLNPDAWQHVGASDETWTAGCTGPQGLARWTATSSSDPASAVGRTGVLWPSGGRLQGGEDSDAVHYHAIGYGRVTIVDGA